MTITSIRLLLNIQKFHMCYSKFYSSRTEAICERISLNIKET